MNQHSGIYRTMTEIAASEIREAILNGAFQPGTRLIPSQLEKDLNLGKVAIREALRELAGSGLVVSVPNKGAMVAEAIPIEEIKEIFEIRYLLESKAAYLATPNISEETIRLLESLHDKMQGEEKVHKEYFFLNREFHMAIYQTSGWSYLCQIITQLIDQVQAFRNRYRFRMEDFHTFNLDHQKILDALRRREAEEVGQRIHANVRNGFDTLITVYRQQQKHLSM